jgi:hypothetical protein
MELVNYYKRQFSGWKRSQTGILRVINIIYPIMKEALGGFKLVGRIAVYYKIRFADDTPNYS